MSHNISVKNQTTDRLPIADCQSKLIGNRKSTVANPETHPLPRGGTDFIASRTQFVAAAVLLLTEAAKKFDILSVNPLALRA